ncbi:ParA family protein [Pediococcus pentosaceus]|uniref:ParA family protein n=1 Tax=Pediococcus pentosaceus TaxID=1255 RepID=UPI003981FC9B
MGKVVSFINMKGGVSKTTLLKELAVYASSIDNKNVLVIDVDPQMNLTQSLFLKYGYAATEEVAKEIERAEVDGRVKNSKLTVSKASIANIFQRPKTGDIDYEEAILDLNKKLSIIPGELGINFLQRNLDSKTIETGIEKFIRMKELKEKFDYIFIDCPPTYSSYIAGALIASDAYIIPIRTEIYSVLGVDMLLNVVKAVQEEDDLRFKEPLQNLGIVFTAEKANETPGKVKLKENILKSEKLGSVPKFNNPFKYNPEFPKNLAYTITDSNSRNSKQDLRYLYEEFVEKLEN